MLQMEVLDALCSFMTRFVIDRQRMMILLNCLRVLFEVDTKKTHSASCIQCGGLQFLLEFIAGKETPNDLQQMTTGIVKGYFTRSQIETEMDGIYEDKN